MLKYHIETVELSSAQPAIVFNNIPQSYSDLQLLVSARTTTATYISGLRVEFNNNTSSIYSVRNLQAIYSSGPNSTTNPYNVTTAMVGTFVPGANQTANTFNNVTITVPNYSSSTTGKNVSFDGVSENNSAFSTAEVASVNIASGFFNSTSPITSVKLTIQEGNNFVAGTSISLYGIRRGISGELPVATGGTVTTAGGYTYHTFTASGTFTAYRPVAADILVVAGGGGSGYYGNAGGGGAGGYLEGSKTLSGVYPITVGAGGSGAYPNAASGTNGANSTFGLATAIGGGTGSGPDAVINGSSGGSGGGGGFNGSSYGSGGLALQSNSDGLTGYGGNGKGGLASGGGGGAGGNAPGVNYDFGYGPGRAWLNGVTYATGGGAGKSYPGEAADANTGNGAMAGATGGSGIVIVRYKTPA